ncbi:MAG TPA: energy-dependent translational throttle protein EttA [Anaerolineaceae bacterium]|nr:energy-dependent translational throttle protein EttA [Anaerolineaceae bacterium]
MPSDTQVIYSMMRVGKIYPPNKQVLRDISLGFYYGAKIGVLGLNGSGKTTLLRIMAGKDDEYVGEIAASKGYTVGLLEQDPYLAPDKTVIEIIKEGVAPITAMLEEYEKVNEGFSDPDADFDKLIEQQARLTEQLEKVDAWNLESNLKLAMGALNCPPGETPINILSGGERRRVALTRLLLTEPDILLLDEPTNHLDAESIEWLEHHLQNYKGTVIAVTHDRYFLDNVAGWILELDRGYGIPWKGNYSSWLEQKQERLRVEEKSETKRQRTLQHELDWIHMSPKARQSKGQARVTAYEKLLSQEFEKERKSLEIYIPSGPRLGNVVIEAEALTKGFGERVLIQNLDLLIPPGSIIGIIGPNGAGKSTLIKMIAGIEKPDSGMIRIGETVKLGYADQSRTLDPELTVFQAITGGADNLQLGDMSVNSRAYCASFNFTGSDQQKSVKTLSGGEKNRVFLARTLTSGANVLLLDEPTNDLDINTLRALEEALENFAGCAVVVSHDRWFLDRISTHILALGHEGKAQLFLGNWSDWEEYQLSRTGKSNDKREPFRELKRS